MKLESEKVLAVCVVVKLFNNNNIEPFVTISSLEISGAFSCYSTFAIHHLLSCEEHNPAPVLRTIFIQNVRHSLLEPFLLCYIKLRTSKTTVDL